MLDDVDFEDENNRLRNETNFKLTTLFKKEYVMTTNRCNEAIDLALFLASTLGKKKVLIQDQGGWLTYKEYPKKYKMDIVELKTDYGLIEINDLEKHPDSVLLINSMPGYIALEQMELIAELCKKNNIFLINDVCGSVGMDEATFGDVIVCSFGRWKPINVMEGGCIATDRNDYFKFFIQKAYPLRFPNENHFLRALNQRLDFLGDRINFLTQKRQEVLFGTSGFDIIHPNAIGLNVVIAFKSADEKDAIIEYCYDNGLEYTTCPRYIRVNTNAISIEIKRLDNLQPDEEDNKFSYFD